ncbi:MAG: di-heme oxidoredictase family protein [Sneathiella sp.]|uniref:di-heme oxidoreductase family protein n=1 Tax=Sneathiella sp. TaxID=1964365 RepID=UPI003001FE8A
MTHVRTLVLLASLSVLTVSTGAAQGPPQRITPYPGGETTQPTRGKNSFSLPAANLNRKDLRIFFFGNRLFNTNWVAAPASVKSLDGLGPTFNRVSCSGCHLRDGRGRPPGKIGEKFQSMLIRLSVPGQNKAGGPKPHPHYGDQLNDRAILSVPAEGFSSIETKEMKGSYADGMPYQLSAPLYRFTDLAYGPFGDDIMISPRVAPPVFGLGLLEAIKEEDILALADPDDQSGNGISGRVNTVWDQPTATKKIGRFGWKANSASLQHQNAAAAAGDIGLTSTLFPEANCPAIQENCLSQAALAKGVDLSDNFMAKLTFYTQTLAVPARRNVDSPDVLAGEELFNAIGCSSCHIPTFVTGRHPTVPALSNQTIHPFTDLLLHDMGEGLADNRPDFDATGREWRTPPLWGIGLTKAVNKHTRFLHDGRARSVEEAILWHGGEAEAAKEQFRLLPLEPRIQLLKFLNSL